MIYKRWFCGSLLFLFINAVGVCQSLDDQINDAFMPVAISWENLIFTTIPVGPYDIPIVLILLVGGATFFTIYFGFVNVRHFKTAINIVRGKYEDLSPHETDVDRTIRDESAEGELKPLQALTTAVSGTVGLGNIAMVAVAISIGGPGATFWMIIAGLLGMTSKFVECTLGVKYREIENNKVYGGPMYYLSKGLKEKGFPGFGKFLAVWFSIMCVGASFGGGNAFQTNQAAAQIISRFGLEGGSTGTIIGIIFAVFTGIVILGGIKRIGGVTEKIVPMMAALYVGACLFVILSNFSLVGEAIGAIISEAFTPRASITGGLIGVMIQGFRRAAFSNEAGAGSAAIAHAAVKTKYPASEGFVALLEPFIDTVVICTMTALVIVIFNMNDVFIYGDVIDNEALLASTGERIGGINITSMAFDHSIPGFSYVLVLAVTLFAFSTIISWSYYGLQSWTYLFGKSKISEISFKVVFLIFTVLGSAVTLDAVIKFSDAMILALVFPNMIGLIFLFGVVKREVETFLSDVKRE